MAGAKWGAFFDLEESLLREGPSYSFFQAVRLIRLMLRRREDHGIRDAASLESRFLRIRPELTLGFPSADIARIEETDLEDHERRFIVYATFLGLYGTSSPLPSFYTEDLLHEAGDDKSVTRDFIDIINYKIFPLFIRSLLKYNLFLQICEENNIEYLERIFCLVGLNNTPWSGESSDSSRRLLRYSGIMCQHPRSAYGLKTMLSDSFPGIPVHISEFIPRVVPIPQEQTALLGIANVSLGDDLHLGSEIPECMGKFRIFLGPVKPEMASSCFPGGEVLKQAVLLVENYLDSPLDYDFELLFDPAGIPAFELGVESSAIMGVNSWLPAASSDGYVTTRFGATSSDDKLSTMYWRNSC